MYEQCKTCVKEDVCPKAYYFGAFEDGQCRRYISALSMPIFQFQIDDTAYYLRSDNDIAESRISTMKINKDRKLRYRVVGCGRDLIYGVDLFRTYDDAVLARHEAINRR